jgi:hypothetical protein
MGLVEPSVVDNRESGRFEILVDGELAGVAEYRRSGSSVMFSHTEIEPRFEGHGLGSILARAALDATRAERLSVLPFCPFIRGFVQRHPDYQELVPADRRALFGLEADPTG